MRQRDAMSMTLAWSITFCAVGPPIGTCCGPTMSRSSAIEKCTPPATMSVIATRDEVAASPARPVTLEAPSTSTAPIVTAPPAMLMPSAWAEVLARSTPWLGRASASEATPRA